MASEWKGSFHLLIAFLISTVSLVQSNTCIIEEFEVEPNFNETRFAGKWYELSWIILPWIKPEWNYLDYTHTYTQTDYGYYYIGSGRDPYNQSYCLVETPSWVYRTESNAKYLKTHKLAENSGHVNASYWIIETDYDNYALVFGCREVAPNGTCVAPDGWLWSRCPYPATKYTKKMEDKLSKICLTKEQFTVTSQDNECGDKIGTCGDTGSGSTNFSYWLTITVAITFLASMIDV